VSGQLPGHYSITTMMHGPINFRFQTKFKEKRYAWSVFSAPVYKSFGFLCNWMKGSERADIAKALILFFFCSHVLHNPFSTHRALISLFHYLVGECIYHILIAEVRCGHVFLRGAMGRSCHVSS